MDIALLKQLGLSKDQITNMIVERCASELMRSTSCNEYGEEETVSPSKLKQQLQELVTKRINEEVTRIADAHVLPRVTEMVEGLTLQETNKWGEKKGEPLSFVEYLVARADAYMREKVNHAGKSEAEDGNSYNWKASTTRVSYLIHEHLQYSIKTAMEQAMKSANASIAGGIQTAVKIKLQEVLDEMNRKR